MEFFAALSVLVFWMSLLLGLPIALANSTTGPGPDERPASAAMNDEYGVWQQGYRHEALRFRHEPFIEHHGGVFPWMMGVAWVVLVAMAARQIYFFCKMEGGLRREPATTAHESPSAKITRQVLRPNMLAAEHIKLMGQFNIILPEFRTLQDCVSSLRDNVIALQTRFATALTELDTLKVSFRDQELEDTVIKLRDQIVRIDEWRKLQKASTPANQVDEDTIKRIVGYMNLASKTGEDEDITRVKPELDQLKQSIVTRERFTETDEQVSQLKLTIYSKPWKIVRKELQSELEAVRKELEDTKQKTVGQELQSDLEAVRKELEEAKQHFVTDKMRDFLAEVVQGNALVNGMKDVEALRAEQLKMKKVAMSAIEDVESKYDTLGSNHDDLVAKVTKLEEIFSLGPSQDEFRKEYEDLNISVHTSLKELNTSLTTVKDMEKRLADSYGRVKKCEKQQDALSSKLEAGKGAANEKGLMEGLQSKMADFKTRKGEIDTRISLVEKEIEGCDAAI